MLRQSRENSFGFSHGYFPSSDYVSSIHACYVPIVLQKKAFTTDPDFVSGCGDTSFDETLEIILDE